MEASHFSLSWTRLKNVMRLCYLDISMSKIIVPDEIKGRHIDRSFPMTLIQAIAKFLALMYSYLDISMSKIIVPDETKGRHIHHSFLMTLIQLLKEKGLLAELSHHVEKKVWSLDQDLQGATSLVAILLREKCRSVDLVLESKPLKWYTNCFKIS